MASLKPGILLKLLQNVDNKEAKVVGEHRSALLQVCLLKTIICLFYCIIIAFEDFED